MVRQSTWGRDLQQYTQHCGGMGLHCLQPARDPVHVRVRKHHQQPASIYVSLCGLYNFIFAWLFCKRYLNYNDILKFVDDKINQFTNINN